ncbi:Na+/H+ antiporter [Rhodoplanes elegans]|uniref:Na+/H+ antiporter n=1 Tax=Rhodoplanes elegans TaxID=29408 RepID=A0A327KLU5_9BRAD|nr:Na+/H+ antiporter [Rhodoplanes elegans]MBK5960113.1 Na+/H+ antiporter [Rhodoplanes elegans]RAI38435.1 Na+/H+ antiporter [Rhodoplanes elegans]
MTAIIQTFLLLLAVLVAVAVLARRLNVAPSIILVIAGVALAFVPGLPAIELAPEFVLLVVLPPLIYLAGVAMSWREFRFNLRSISLLAFGCVVFTTIAVAAGAHYLIGLPWPVAFVLGAIVSPPDVVAPLAVARRLGLPRRVLVVLEGEGLANDATALILYRFAVAAVSTGVFSFPQAAGTFGAIVVGEVFWGIAVGWISLRLRHWARDPRVEITLSIMTPYLCYWVPEHLGGSGVLATVAAGLYVSWNGPLLISSATRLQGVFFWDLFVYLLEGFIFLITGMQARALIERIQSHSLSEIVAGILVTTAICIVARFVWVFPAVYLPRWLIPSLRARDPSPEWQRPFMIAFVGVRGVVSLAAALALPFALQSGAPFPYRDFIVVVTFGVIVITLVGQGLMMPLVMRWLGLAAVGTAEARVIREQELRARHSAAAAAHARLEAIAGRDGLTIDDDVSALLEARNDQRTRVVPRSLDDEDFATAKLGARLRLELIEAERVHLHKLEREGEITDESRRRIERELDLEEASIACKSEAYDPPL